MCIYGDNYYFSRFHYLTTVKKQTGAFLPSTIHSFHSIFGTLHPEYSTDTERFHNISRHFLNLLPEYGNTRAAKQENVRIMIEGYSMGSKGLVFNIAENTGVLKQKLWECGYIFEVVPPTTIKKFATGKGNADKDQMLEAFIKETHIDLKEHLTPDKKLGSPVTDIIDAYYIARFCKEKWVGVSPV